MLNILKLCGNSAILLVMLTAVPGVRGDVQLELTNVTGTSFDVLATPLNNESFQALTVPLQFAGSNIVISEIDYDFDANAQAAFDSHQGADNAPPPFTMPKLPPGTDDDIAVIAGAELNSNTFTPAGVPVTLARISFVPPVGTTTITINGGVFSTPEAVLADGTRLTEGSGLLGVGSQIAVPEPSSFLAVGLIAVGCLAYRRWKGTPAHS